MKITEKHNYLEHKKKTRYGGVDRREEKMHAKYVLLSSSQIQAWFEQTKYVFKLKNLNDLWKMFQTIISNILIALNREL